MMWPLPTREQWRRWTLPSRLSFIGSLSSVLGLGLALASLAWLPRPSEGISDRIDQLDEIRVALTTLEGFVEAQRDALEALSTEKLELEAESERLRKALQIDKEELDALLQYQAARARQSVWFRIIVSFFVGVLSSSIVTFVGSAIQSRRAADTVSRGDRRAQRD